MPFLKQGKINEILVIIIAALAMLFLALILLSSTNGRSKEAAIKSSVSQLRAVAEIHYSKENSYIDLRNNTDIISLKEFIEGYGGTEFVINISPDGANYCVKVKIPSSYPKWVCVDDGNNLYSLTDDPLCSEDFFACEYEIPDWQACFSDSDCIVADGGCCDCYHGGTAIAINKDLKQKWEEKLLKECKGIECLDVISDDPSCFKKPECVNGVCQLAETDDLGPKPQVINLAVAESETVQLEIKDFSTDKKTYGSFEEIKAYLTVVSSGEAEEVLIKLTGIKPRNHAYINSSQTVHLDSGENKIIFSVTTPRCTSGCGGVAAGPYDLNAEIFIKEDMAASSVISINLTDK